MRKIIVASAAASTLFSSTLFVPSAFAEPTPTPSPSASSLTPFEQYRIDRENFFAAMKTITNNFKVACDAANSSYATALTSAKSKDQKRAARFARESAITEATIAFESAKSDLGPMPIEPQRMAKAPGKNKVKLR